MSKINICTDCGSFPLLVEESTRCDNCGLYFCHICITDLEYCDLCNDNHSSCKNCISKKKPVAKLVAKTNEILEKGAK